jgi:hypothetical protein
MLTFKKTHSKHLPHRDKAAASLGRSLCVLVIDDIREGAPEDPWCLFESDKGEVVSPFDLGPLSRYIP